MEFGGRRCGYGGGEDGVEIGVEKMKFVKGMKKEKEI